MILHFNTAGHMSVPTVGGCYYLTLFNCETTRKKLPELHVRKSDFAACLSRIFVKISEFGRECKVIHCDNTPEYLDATVDKVLREFKVQCILANPYESSQNCIPERSIRTITESARTQMDFSTSSHTHPRDKATWGFTCIIACTIFDVLPPTDGTGSPNCKWALESLIKFVDQNLQCF